MIKVTSTKASKSFANILIYGKAGAGKTYLCRTAKKPLIISAEGGLMSLNDADLPVITIKTRGDCDEAYDYVKASLKQKKYDTVCIDSLSEIAEVLLNDEKALTKDARQAYGVMNTAMATLIRGFRDLEMHVYFTCKEKRVVDEASNRVTFIPSVPGNVLLQDLPYFFDEVLCLRLGKLKDGTLYRYLQTQRDLQYEAKDRSGNLDPQEEPDLRKLISKIIKA